MLTPISINVNINGIPTLRSLNVTVGSADVRFAFNNHRNVGLPFRGLMIVDLARLKLVEAMLSTVTDLPLLVPAILLHSTLVIRL